MMGNMKKSNCRLLLLMAFYGLFLILGAAIFSAIESPLEVAEIKNMRERKSQFLRTHQCISGQLISFFLSFFSFLCFHLSPSDASSWVSSRVSSWLIQLNRKLSRFDWIAAYTRSVLMIKLILLGARRLIIIIILTIKTIYSNVGWFQRLPYGVQYPAVTQDRSNHPNDATITSPGLWLHFGTFRAFDRLSTLTASP